MHTNLNFCNGIGIINVFYSLIKKQIKLNVIWFILLTKQFKLY